MAKPALQSNGRYRFQPTGPNGHRLSIRWGQVTVNQAAQIAGHIETLITSAETATAVPRGTLLWLTDIGNELHEQLAAARLVEPRRSALLGKFITDFMTESSNKPATITRYKSARRRLVKYFGERCDLVSITTDAARAWHRSMLGELSPATVARDVGLARQFFNDARRRGFVQDNPFDGLSAVVRPDKDRQHYIDQDTITAVIAACPNAEWRALVTIARYAGLRVPSEVRTLTWSAINWERDRFTVRSPKTEHHAQGDRRIVPLFPEVRSALADLFDQAEPGEDRVFTMNMGQGSALRKPFHRIIERAGFAPWDKLWQNLRSSCQTDLVQDHPQHAVCAWLGNSEKIADIHYLQVTDAHFAAAIAGSNAGAPAGAALGSKRPHDDTESSFPLHKAASGSIAPPYNRRNRTRTCDLCYVTAAL